MGKGKDGVKKPAQIEREVESIRNEMTPVVSELDRRRHELTDWRFQLRRHRPELLKAAAALIGIVTIVRVFRRRRARASARY